ncbi:MAG: sulfotransferase family 2 domain-containing protein [Candidatus Aegiribacteria sp.]|nr:sulfotransferase family 2 domain-containing protein [Candidatus Aegiribacteria sp.]
MIISHRYRYLFVQVPQTASSSIGTELCENYAGEPILYKHARYSEFLEEASPEEKEYFVFAGIRNPLDCMVTEYFRRKAGKRTEENRLHLEKYIFIRDNNATFSEFVKKYHHHFHKPERFLYRDVNFIYKYENLQVDFSRVLVKLDIEQKRPLPRFNKTTGKTEPFLSYYTGEIQPIVRIALGKRMKQAGYRFPADWLSSPGRTPFLCLTALVRTAALVIRLMRMRSNAPVNPGSHDTYTRRLRKVYIEDKKTGADRE